MATVSRSVDSGARTASASVVLVVAEGVEIVVGRLAGRRADVVLVDVLARLQLAARRLGCSIRLRDASAELSELLALVGLDLRLQVVGETECCEQGGVDEVVEPDDPTA